MKAYIQILFLVLISAASFTASAVSYPGYSGHRGNTSPYYEPAEILKTGINKLTVFLQNGGGQNREKARAFLETEVSPYFDFAYMTRWAAGPAWRKLDPGQRAIFQERLTSSFMSTLVKKLTTYTNQPIRYFTPRGQSSNDISVSAWIIQPNGYPTKLEFRFYRSPHGWKIFDVKAAGNSAVVYYRNQFRNLFRSNNMARH